mmetsp:Transcript_7107/g.15556  ORF Transcript_7107/g.15556 Transcript_7107/m.15556 type:complete len:389 (+) Transcript_7107:124-1290(+)
MSKKWHQDHGCLGSQLYKGCIYTVLAFYTVVIIIGRRFLPTRDQWCPYSNAPESKQRHYHNPDYNNHPCHRYRTPYLLFLHLQEIEFAQRMIFALILGGIIGFERRASERPAGIRTMSMVCLGSCFFCMASQLAFRSSTMGWDAARVAAAVPSGVGFLGAGLIWKGGTTQTQQIDGKILQNSSQEVHGLTTAASVWLSAAVGVAVGGGRRLYIVSVYGVALVILVLRFGPQIYFAKDSESMEDWEEEMEELDWESFTDDSSQGLSQMDEKNEIRDKEHNIGINNFISFRDPVPQNIDARSDSPPKTNHDEMQPLLKTNELLIKEDSSFSLSRNASAPNLTYLTPIVDHGQLESGTENAGENRGGKGIKSSRRIGKRRMCNKLKLSFHG